MNRRLAPLALVAAFALAGCGGAAYTSTAPGQSSTAEVEQRVPDLTGAWKQANSASEDAYQQATITGDDITIEWVSDGGETTSTYWVGTFQAPKAQGPHTWVSTRDKAATDSALLASTDDTKEFTYADNTISYKVSALGTTTTVKLEKK